MPASYAAEGKVGVNKVRSRGDREEPFGGIGESWKGCFVGGEYLVRAVTQGPAGEQLYGNFPDHTLAPRSVVREQAQLTADSRDCIFRLKNPWLATSQSQALGLCRPPVFAIYTLSVLSMVRMKPSARGVAAD